MNRSVSLRTARWGRGAVARVIVCGAALLLPSCKLPDLRQPELAATLPTTYAGADNAGAAGAQPPGADSSARLGVQEFFGDPTLTRLIDEGLAANRELKILEEEVRVAANEFLSRRGAYLPFVGFRGAAGLGKHSQFTPEGAAEEQLQYLPGKNFPGVPGDFLFGLDVLVPLDIWRELRNARDAARQRYLAAVERRNDFVTRMVADIAENYYALLALDRRTEVLDQTIALQEKSLETARAMFAAGRATELAVQRFRAEVRKNQSEKLIVRQEIVEAENRINFLAGRLPQPVERAAVNFFDLALHPLSVGTPVQLLENRPDVRQAERELAAAGLDVKVARARFFPRVDVSGYVGYQAFNPRYLFYPEAFATNIAGDLTAPLVNRAAIRAEYRTANARQLESVYNYQRVVLSAYTEVVNRVAMAENYQKSIDIKKQQLTALEASVDAATKLFQNARAEYVEVLLAQRDLLEARTVLIDTKRQQLSAVVNAYQALGGGTALSLPAALPPTGVHGKIKR
jgi:multidrug efflux system outer membrane protein